MANGAEHAVATRRLGTLLQLGAVAAAFAGHPLPAIGIFAGAIGGHMATPDLDLPGLTHCENRIRRFNRILGALWVALWIPYGLLVPHRSWVSHLPGVGTAIRMLYLLWWLPFLWLWLELPVQVLTPVALFAWSAWSAQDTMHLHLDGWRLKS